MQIICPYCNTDARFVKGDVVYPHRPDLHHKRFWLCEPCDAYVGVHRRNPRLQFNGDEPLGRLANAELRKEKQRAHSAFDPLWSGYSPAVRSKAYVWLAEQLAIPIEECHIGLFDIEQCRRVIDVCTNRKTWSPPALTAEEQQAQDAYIALHDLPF